MRALASIGVVNLEKRILLVEADKNYAESLRKMIQQQGYEVTHLTTPIKAVAEFAKKDYDLVISDFLLKEIDGIMLLTILKEIDPQIRCILLIAFPEEEVEMEAIDKNIDHCLSKDKTLPILLKYIQSSLKMVVRTKEPSSYSLSSSIEQISVDTKTRAVVKENQLVSLTTKEYELLVLFLKNKGIALSREKIAQEIWLNEDETMDLRMIDGHIKRLRSKLSLFSISSVRGFGYKWSEK